MKIYFASDHAGFELKNKLVEFVRALGYEAEDLGAHEYNPDDDYPDFISRAAREVSRAPETSRAVVLGGSGQGEAIVANKFSGVRAVVFYGPAFVEGSAAAENLADKPTSVKIFAAKSAGEPNPTVSLGEQDKNIIKLSRAHNDANVLSLGARFVTEEEAKEAVKLWLETPFTGAQRHVRRIEKIKEIENVER